MGEFEFMDLLYSRYSNPFEFMNLYMNQGRFGEFVENIIKMDNDRKKEAFEKDDNDKLFQMYLRSMSEKSFIEWKNDVLNSSKKESKIDNTEETVVNIVNNSTNILEGFNIEV